ncbi:hypothetical protein DQM14_02145 [Limosilactobacillus fermentum]|uniref:putative HNHc nuclease n=1 Tax=Limosilactobacillus fermentum TaxID=1613 RepID=UPI000E093EB1|nr:putative HNHc nuclease [Limosilactobacillus fermentum]RDG20905.1 hypothetical protein DQM14_02145 [Limosilactobacillus fermentum]
MISGTATWKDDRWEVIPDKPPGQLFFEHLETLNSEEPEKIKVMLEFPDPRQARPKQRALFFALLHDIWDYTGQPEGWLKDYFYSRFTIRTAGKTISLSNETESTVSDATFLIDDVIDFIFEYEIPVKTGYALLPRDENHFQWRCIRHRKCLVCGQHADIHHVDELGAGRNRNKQDHTKFRLAALCREHHTEIHQIGVQEFLQRHHFTGIGIKVDADTLKSIGLQGIYKERN